MDARDDIGPIGPGPSMTAPLFGAAFRSRPSPAPVPHRSRTPRWPRLARAAGSAWADVVLALACAAVALLKLDGSPRSLGILSPWWIGALLGLAGTLPVALRRRAPVAVVAVLGAVAAVLNGFAITSYAIDLALGCSVYTAAVRLDRRTSIVLLVAVEAVLLGGSIGGFATQLLHRGRDVLAIHTLSVVAALWFAGANAQTGRRYADAVLARAEQERIAAARVEAERVQEERIRIARELHDVVAHGLAVITVQAGVGARNAGGDPVGAAETLREIERAGRTAQGELRPVLELLRDGRPKAEDRTPTPTMSDLDALVAQVGGTGAAVRFHRSGDAPPPLAVQITVYRIVQESLTNCLKHAPGSDIDLRVVVDASAVTIEVRNNVGRTVPSRPIPTGHGLIGMRERVAAFGGWLHAGLVEDEFEVVARIPIGGAR